MSVKTDFITSARMEERSEHIYIRLRNQYTGKEYHFHLPKGLFTTMLDNKQITTDKYEFVKQDNKMPETMSV